jgi:glycolate oxidase iron-sulfur subunit
MLRDVYPLYIPDYDLQVVHYLDLLREHLPALGQAAGSGAPIELVMHDSCVMTRSLDIIEQGREVMANVGVDLAEPENNRVNTACCGGPIEYAFPQLSRRVSSLRAHELASHGRKVLVTCPICLINLAHYENELGLRVGDLGEVLFDRLNLGQVSQAVAG